MQYPIKHFGLNNLKWAETAMSTELPSFSKYLILYLSTYMNKDHDLAWPSQARIMQEMSISNGALNKHLNIIESEGWIARERGNSTMNTRYYATFPKSLENAVQKITNTPPDGVHTPRDGLRTPPDVAKVVHEVETNNPLNNPSNNNCIGESKKTASTVPYQSIVDLYHETLPNNPHIAKLNDSRKRQIKARWNNGIGDIDAWRRYFDMVSESKFLTGQCPPSRDRSKPFVADIDFLIKEANVLKIVEGKYHE